MWYTLGYANTFICTPAHGGRAGNARDRSPVLVRLYRTPLPEPPGQCRGAVYDHHCTSLTRHRPDGPQHHSCLPPARPHRAPATIVTAAYHGGDLHPGGLRGPAGVVAPESTDVWQAHEPVDAGTGRRGEFCRGADPAAGQRRSDSGGPAPVGRSVDACPALHYQSRSSLSPKKTGATA